MRVKFSVAGIADWLHPESSVWKGLAMLKAFFDESGVHSDSPVTAIAGFIGTKDQWVALEPEWRRVLGEFADRGVKSFHMAEAFAQKGQFAGVDKPSINYILTQLGDVLRASRTVPILSAVIVDDWNKVVRDSDFLARFPKPIDLCFENLVQSLRSWALKYAGGETVCPVFAYHQEFSPRMAEIGRLYGAQDWYRSVLGAIAFDYPDRLIPLQCADLLAHQANWDVERRRYGPYSLAEGGPTALLDAVTGGQYLHGNWFDAEALAITIKRFKETGQI